MDRPDTTERAIRFICGAIFGVLIGGALLLFAVDLGLRAIVLGIVGIALLCGVLAARTGDRFWLNVRHWIRCL